MTPKLAGQMAAIAIIVATLTFMMTREPSNQADAGLEPLRDTLINLAAGIRGGETDACGQGKTGCKPEETRP